MKKYLLLLPVLALTLSGCTDVESSNNAQSKTLEENQVRLIESVPVPKVEQSEDRKNIAKRAELFASDDKVSYIYLLSYGKVMAFYPIKGKVVSTRSYMVPQEQIVNSKGVPCTKKLIDGCSSYGYIVGAPDIDGTYGDSQDAVFFFTADSGAYVEWKGDYMVSDQPLKLTTQPELVRKIQ